MYETRDIENLEPFYTQHVSAMTGEGLHDKSAIAAELAWRDMLINQLKRQMEENKKLYY